MSNKQICPDDFAVNENKKYTGKVTYFNKKGGFGFIEPDDKKIAPDNRLMVLWREIQSSDRWPYLHKDLRVQFKLQKFPIKKGGFFLRGVNITDEKGKKISLQAELDSKREFVISQNTRFTGLVKFYNVTKGFGFVEIDGGFAKLDDVPKEIRISRPDIVTENDAPVLRPLMKVEFGIQKNLKGNFSCYHLTNPGGKAIKRLEVEERKNAGEKKINGEISFYNRREGWGYIKPNNLNDMPKNVRTSIEESTKKAQARSEKNGKSKQMESLVYFRRGDIQEGFAKHGNKASFKMYLDNRGAGAHQVSIAA